MRRWTRRQRVGAAVSGVAAALVGGLVLQGRPGHIDGRATVTSTWFGALVAPPTAPPPPSQQPAEAPAGALAQHGPEERQVCGGGWVKVGPDGVVAESPPESIARTAALRETTLARLRADPEAYPRAVAAWLGDGDGVASLVGLALGSRDPKLYGFAFRFCRQVDASGSACSLLSAAQWARLDPGNAAPWLYALNDASSSKDAAGVAEALFQISRSQRVALNLSAPLQPVLDALPEGDASLIDGFGVALEAIGRVAATPLAFLPQLRDACHGQALADANRSQVCSRVAELLADHSDDLTTRGIGAGMVTELTGSSERQALYRAQLEAWTEAQFPAGMVADPFQCKFVRQMFDRLREQALYGEAGAVDRWVERSGLTPKALIERARMQRDRRTAAASAAAAQEASASEVPTTGASTPAEPPNR